MAKEHSPLSCAWDGSCGTQRPVPVGPEPHKVGATCGLGLARAQLPAATALQSQAVCEAHVCTHGPPALLTDRADESLFLVITVQTTHSPGCSETLRTHRAMC